MAQDTEWTPVSHDTCDQVAGPFYHGTRADLAVGELLSAGFRSNYRDSVVMNHWTGQSSVDTQLPLCA